MVSQLLMITKEMNFKTTRTGALKNIITQRQRKFNFFFHVDFKMIFLRKDRVPQGENGGALLRPIFAFQ